MSIHQRPVIDTEESVYISLGMQLISIYRYWLSIGVIFTTNNIKAFTFLHYTVHGKNNG